MPIDPPSSELQSQLTSLGLEATHWQSAQSVARDMARGLPVMDSLWLDALVRLRVLTPLQARCIEQGDGARLLVGENWKVTRARHLDPVMSVYDACPLRGSRHALVTEIELPADAGQPALSRLRQLIAHCEPLPATLAGIPVETHWNGRRIHVVSRLAAGETLGRLLVRRGRFPESVVRELAAEIFRQLALVESRGGHGDVRLSNLMLASDGTLSLLNWGVFSSVWPALSLYSALPIDLADTLPPERLQPERRTPAGSSDLYACGCVLWQLLAGRPCHLVADPLQKLIAHQNREIPDVREMAPETSAPLAELIRSLTSRDSQRRPQRIAEAQQALQSSGVRARRALQSYSSTLARPVTGGAVRKGAGRLRATGLAAAVMLGVLGSAIAWNRDWLGLPRLTNMDAGTAGRQHGFVPLSAQQQLPPLPPPDEQGLVTLLPGQKYAAGQLQGGKELIIRSSARATILVDEEPLELQADRVLLENVRVIQRRSQSDRKSPPALVRVRAQELRLRHCRLLGEAGDLALIDWTAQQESDPRSCRLLMADSALTGGLTAVLFRSPLETALCENVLFHDVHAAFEFLKGPRAGLAVPLLLRNCTLRTRGAPFAFSGETLAAAGQLSLQGTASVIDVPRGEPLFSIASGNPATGWENHLKVAADSLVLPEDCPLASFRSVRNAPPNPLPAELLSAEGVIAGRFHFEESVPPQPPGAILRVDFLPVRPAGALLGADESRLPLASED